MKPIKRIGVLVVIAIGLLTPAVFAEWKETEISRDVPLPPPEKIEIVPPDPSLPPEIAAFSGRWEGIWNESGRKAVIIVEKIDSKEAQIIHGYGRARAIDKPNWGRLKGKIIGGNRIDVPLYPTGKHFSEMNKDLKTISGVSEFPRQMVPSTITMHKVED